MKYKILLVPVAMGIVVQSGEYNRPEAPEKWSTPEEVTIYRENNIAVDHPCVSADGNTIYSDGISAIYKKSNGWSSPVSLNDQISRNLARKPCISPNNRQLFFTWWVGGWQLFYSVWDDDTGDWGIPVNCGLGGYAEAMPNDSTLLISLGSLVSISHLNKKENKWEEPEPFPVENLGVNTAFGFWLSPTFDKYYYNSMISDTTRDGEYFLNYYIAVAYEDSTNPKLYTRPFILNICLESDSLYLTGEYEGRFEAWPTFTADGRTMYFIADYHGYLTLYETHMIIDENGDSVKTEIKPPEPDTSETINPELFILKMPYPNPFNNRITIEYELPNNDQINLSIYDLSGRLVALLRDGVLPAGYYSDIFDGSNLASGIYFIVLNGRHHGMQTKKILLLK